MHSPSFFHIGHELRSVDVVEADSYPKNAPVFVFVQTSRPVAIGAAMRSYSDKCTLRSLARYRKLYDHLLLADAHGVAEGEQVVLMFRGREMLPSTVLSGCAIGSLAGFLAKHPPFLINATA